MANQFSDHFAASQPGLALAAPAVKVPWGVNNRHYKRASIILDLSPSAFTIADVARLMTLKSSDRIADVYVSASGGTAVAADLGLYLAGQDHNGAVVDADLFASAITLAGTVARTERFIESGVNVDTDRGQAVWQLLGLTSDPGVEYDLCFLATGTLTTADATVTVEAFGSFS